MFIRLLPFILALCLSALRASAQVPVNVQNKCDGKVRRAIAQQQTLTSIILKCDDSQSVVDAIKARGYRATVITGSIITAQVPSSYIMSLVGNNHVQYIQSPRQAYSEMTEARQATGADRVQSGEGLDSPYDGKDVIIGVIDQGFEFRHIAFLDSANNPRVLAVWNRKGYSAGTDSQPTTDIPSNGDGINVEGHGTHVANIAAGSKIAENDYYGMASGADIVMIPSELSESEIIEDVKYIRDFAASKGKPWVINMSFGSQLGSHDGKNYFSQAVDEILAEGKGRQIVVASGNDGLNKEHASFTIKNSKDTVRLVVVPGSTGAVLDVWSQTSDSLHHINVRPFVYTDGARDYHDSAFWANNEYTHQIAPFNDKENYVIGIPNSVLLGSYLGAEITGTEGTEVHAWTAYGYGDFTSGKDSTYVDGDNQCCVNDIGGCADNTVTVAAYVSSHVYPSINGSQTQSGYGEIGDIASFSSSGPALCEACKPTVAAPGAIIKSAVSKYGIGFDKTSSTIVQDVRRGLKHFYYGAMVGTSMSTPAVTGIIALWLEANPNLTYSQILDIIKKTSKKDSYTGSEEWNAEWGYGKIDAYNGLKEALRLADESGVTSTYCSAEPFTLSKTNDSYKILLNSNENIVNVSILDLDGRIVLDNHYYHACRGNEYTVNFNALNHGIYILRITTTSNKTIRKFVY